MQGGIPTDVIVEDGIEAFLEIDAFRQTIGAYQDIIPTLFDQRFNTIFPFRRGQLTGDAFDLDGVGQGAAQFFGDILGGVDKSAKHNGLEAFLNQ